jgi:hypothetical protein
VKKIAPIIDQVTAGLALLSELLPLKVLDLLEPNEDLDLEDLELLEEREIP